jgi:threonyl-tRNA synthetase
VVGAKEVETKKVTLEHRDKGQLGQMSIEEILEKLQKEIKDKVL